jgi:LacI family transcriptional regulator
VRPQLLRVERRVKRDHEHTFIARLLDGRDDRLGVARHRQNTFYAAGDHILDRSNLASVIAIVLASGSHQFDALSIGFFLSTFAHLNEERFVSVLVINPTMISPPAEPDGAAVPPQAATSKLRRADQRTATIGLLLDDVSNPFSLVLHRAIEDIAQQHNTLVFAGSSDQDPDREEEMVRAFASRRVDGMIVVPASQERSGLLHVRRLGRPVVLVDRPAAIYDADSVTVDNHSSIGTAIRHLAAHGHRRIAFLGDLHSIWTATERHLGYIEGLAMAGLQLDPRLVRLDIRNIDTADRITLELLGLDAPPSAFLAGQNRITIGVVRALQRLGLQHPIALVGFDDFLLADLLDPRVTVLAQDPVALGRMAADLLFARLAGDRTPAQHVIVPTELIPRGSGEIAAGEPHQY